MSETQVLAGPCSLSGGPGENPPFPLLASGVCPWSLGLPGARMHHSSHTGVFSCVFARSTCYIGYHRLDSL